MEEIEKRVDALEKGHVRVEEQIKTLFNQQAEFSKLIASMQEMTVNLRLLTTAQQGMKEKIGKMADDIDEIKEKPAKKWENLVWLVITAVASALIGYALAGAGLK